MRIIFKRTEIYKKRLYILVQTRWIEPIDIIPERKIKLKEVTLKKRIREKREFFLEPWLVIAFIEALNERSNL